MANLLLCKDFFRNNLSIEGLVFLCAALLPWQFFLKVYGRIDLPATVFIVFFGFFVTLIKADSTKFSLKLRMPILGYLLILAGMGLSSLFLSDSLHEPLNVLGRLGVGFLILLIISYSSIKINTDAVVKVFLFSTIPLGIMGIVFFIIPEMEAEWLNIIAGVLIETDSLAEHSNVWDINKIGVVFSNANVGAAYWGMSMWLALWMRERHANLSRLIYTLFAVTFCLNVMYSGSRGGLLVLLATTFITFAVRFFSGPGKKHEKTEAVKNTLIILITVGLAFFIDTGLQRNIYAKMIDRTLNETKIDKQSLELSSDGKPPSRKMLWAHSIKVISKAPLSGYGIVKLSDLGFPDRYPPHNMYMQIWIYGGAAAMIGTILLFGSVLISQFNLLKIYKDAWIGIVLILWIVLHGMFENIIIENYRISMLLWLMISLLLWNYKELSVPGVNNEEQYA